VADGSLGFANGGSTGAPMHLIVGLGNPGIEYAWTPHNMGFLAVDAIAESAGIRVERPEAKSWVGRGTIAGRDVALAKPQTMMNLSGLAVRELTSRAECEPSDIIVICDDIALPWGMLRIRERGTAGGHNGLKSVIGAIGTTEFVRVRLGVKPSVNALATLLVLIVATGVVVSAILMKRAERRREREMRLAEAGE